MVEIIFVCFETWNNRISSRCTHTSYIHTTEPHCSVNAAMMVVRLHPVVSKYEAGVLRAGSVVGRLEALRRVGRHMRVQRHE